MMEERNAEQSEREENELHETSDASTLPF